VTRAVLCAGLAGGLGGAALLELAAARAAAPRRRPGALVRALAGLGRRLGGSSAGADLAARLAAAGSPLGLAPADAAALKLGVALVAFGLAAPLAAAAHGRLGLLVLLGAPAAGYLAPDVWLGRRIRSRAHRLERELPDVLELVRVAVQAGMPLGRALADVGERRRGLLGAELRRTAREIALGTPRREALEGLARRCPAAGIQPLVAAIDRAERLGAPLGATLASQARDARASRAARIRESAERAAPKIQLVVALGLVPSVLLLVAAALLSSVPR
jgi:tight adherence protein C